LIRFSTENRDFLSQISLLDAEISPFSALNFFFAAKISYFHRVKTIKTYHPVSAMSLSRILKILCLKARHLLLNFFCEFQAPTFLRNIEYLLHEKALLGAKNKCLRLL